jgi:K+/H+ antiporter YhaU regulatory subunit KhtT
MTDVHRDEIQKLTRLQERQTEALEEIAEQMAIQNGALLSQTRTLEKLVAVNFRGNPDDVPTQTSIASATADGVLNIAEQVDIDRAQRWADE